MERLLCGTLTLLLVGALGCAPRERYTRVVEKVEKQAAAVRVDGIDRVVVGMSFEAGPDGSMQLRVETATAPVSYAGSAVFITPQGNLLTCAHLFDLVEITTITVTSFDGEKRIATLLNTDFPRDLALLKVPGWHDSATRGPLWLQTGQEVIAVGNPHGLEFSVSHGIISNIDRDLGTGFYFTQVDAPINPGNSGGPLFDMHGDLIGINVRAAVGSDGLGFAVTPQVIEDYLSQFRGL